MDYDKIKRLIDDMGSSMLTSLEIDFPDGLKIRMKKGSSESQKTDCREDCNEKIQASKENVSNINMKHYEKISETVVKDASTSGLEDVYANEEEYKYIKSPMVGTFYSKPSPNERSFVEVGEKVKKGATTCIIEAMKLMNEIEAEFDGEVVEILKNDGDPVEFGENLIKLK